MILLGDSVAVGVGDCVAVGVDVGIALGVAVGSTQALISTPVSLSVTTNTTDSPISGSL